MCITSHFYRSLVTRIVLFRFFFLMEEKKIQMEIKIEKTIKENREARERTASSSFSSASKKLLDAISSET